MTKYSNRPHDRIWFDAITPACMLAANASVPVPFNFNMQKRKKNIKCSRQSGGELEQKIVFCAYHWLCFYWISIHTKNETQRADGLQSTCMPHTALEHME